MRLHAVTSFWVMSGWREARVWCLQVVHKQLGLMGWKSVANSFCFKSSWPQGTRAQPKRYIESRRADSLDHNGAQSNAYMLGMCVLYVKTIFVSLVPSYLYPFAIEVIVIPPWGVVIPRGLKGLGLSHNTPDLIVVAYCLMAIIKKQTSDSTTEQWGQQPRVAVGMWYLASQEEEALLCCPASFWVPSCHK